MEKLHMREIVTILFDDFETLDVFGPVEIMGRLEEDFHLNFYSFNGGIIKSSQDVPVYTKKLSSNLENYILMIPGGLGTRKLMDDEVFLEHLKALSLDAEYVLTICTGSILLAKTGFLDGKNVTTNKRVFKWTQQFPKVNWVHKARWLREGNIYTSSGVSTGMDMALGFVADLLGYDVAKEQSIQIEYIWHEDSSWDPFSGDFS
jgi:transcriptional regulator GlxA family with amidase domain